MKNIILDLCGGTGSWSKPWKDAGYRVFNITLPEYNVLDWEAKTDFILFNNQNDSLLKLQICFKDIFGILAAPPCTQFSFARTNAKEPRNLELGMEVVWECWKIIYLCQSKIKSDQCKKAPLKFWAIENPSRGMLKWFLGKPAFVFNPWEFGDWYKKETAIWGMFNEPKKTESYFNSRGRAHKERMKKFDSMASKDIHPEFYGKLTRTERRAITPAGFAKAFFEANK